VDVGKLGIDQIESYAQRMDQPVAEVERRLPSNWGY
jgi:hypothetical protein